MPKILIAVVAIIIIGFLFYSYQNKSQPDPQPVSEEAVVTITPNIDYALEIVTLPGKPAGSSYVIVGSQTKDVREQLPITIEYFKNGESAWKGTIDGDPAKICRDQTGCGMDGPHINDLKVKSGDIIELIAVGGGGAVLAKDSNTVN